MKAIFMAMAAMVVAAPLAHAQVVIQAPPIPGVTVPPPPPRPYPDDYWRHSPEGDWQRRADYHDEEARREAWQRSHCVRDWQGQEYCRALTEPMR